MLLLFRTVEIHFNKPLFRSSRSSSHMANIFFKMLVLLLTMILSSVVASPRIDDSARRRDELRLAAQDPLRLAMQEQQAEQDRQIQAHLAAWRLEREEQQERMRHVLESNDARLHQMMQLILSEAPSTCTNTDTDYCCSVQMHGVETFIRTVLMAAPGVPEHLDFRWESHVSLGNLPLVSITPDWHMESVVYFTCKLLVEILQAPNGAVIDEEARLGSTADFKEYLFSMMCRSPYVLQYVNVQHWGSEQISTIGVCVTTNSLRRYQRPGVQSVSEYYDPGDATRSFFQRVDAVRQAVQGRSSDAVGGNAPRRQNANSLTYADASMTGLQPVLVLNLVPIKTIQ